MVCVLVIMLQPFGVHLHGRQMHNLSADMTNFSKQERETCISDDHEDNAVELLVTEVHSV